MERIYFIFKLIVNRDDGANSSGLFCQKLLSAKDNNWNVYMGRMTQMCFKNLW